MQKKISGLLESIARRMAEEALEEGTGNADSEKSPRSSDKAARAEGARSSAEEAPLTDGEAAELVTELFGVMPEAVTAPKDPPAAADGGRIPFPEAPRRPSQIRAEAGEPAPLDYADMSRKQFAELKKLLRRAAGDGRRIKI